MVACAHLSLSLSSSLSRPTAPGRATLVIISINLLIVAVVSRVFRIVDDSMGFFSEVTCPRLDSFPSFFKSSASRPPSVWVLFPGRTPRRRRCYNSSTLISITTAGKCHLSECARCCDGHKCHSPAISAAPVERLVYRPQLQHLQRGRKKKKPQ